MFVFLKEIFVMKYSLCVNVGFRVYPKMLKSGGIRINSCLRMFIKENRSPHRLSTYLTVAGTGIELRAGLGVDPV